MARELGEAPGSGLGKLLQDERFIVPTHQRDYSWSVSEVSLLLDDVEAAFDRQDKQYFVGLMVFMGGEGREQIVLDGQQRLATLVIYFSAVRNWLAQYSEYQNDSTKVDAWFIGRSEIGTNEVEPRIILNSANHQTFLNYIVKAVPVSDLKAHLGKLKKHDRNRNMIAAAIYCSDRIAGLAVPKHGMPAMTHGEIAKRLVAIVLYFRDAVEIVRLNVTNEETAFTVFETLNDRGVELSPLDLVKNHLFRRAAADSKHVLRDMEDRWVQMMATLSNVNSNAFLKAYWTSRHGRIQAPNLFKEFKGRNRDSAAVLSTSIEMLGVAEQYAALETSDDVVWSPYSPETRDLIRALKLLGARQTHPILLAALKKFDVHEMDRLLRLLEVIIVRYQLIGGGRTGKLEIECARLAQAIYNGKIVDKTGSRKVTTANDVFREFQEELYPSDPTFEAEFSQAKETNNQKCVYLLRRLEREQRRRELQNRAPEHELGVVTLEHILPKKPDSDWDATIKADKTLRADCTYRLGNMCLMIQGENKAADRLPFPKKRKFYAKSDILLTRDVATQYTDWNRETIEKHQAAMAQLASSVWRFR